MSKFGIFILGLVAGAAVAALTIGKGRRKMNTPVLERTKTLDIQLIEAIQKKKPNFVELVADEDGNVIIDKEKHPNLYDWMENG